MATKGKIKQIIGAVVDVHFPDDNIPPEILRRVGSHQGKRSDKLVLGSATTPW